MDDSDILLSIKINYKNDTFKIENKDNISYNDLEKKSIKNFKIQKKEDECLIFTYLDEDGDKNILSKTEDILEGAKKLSEDKYLLELTLSISKKENNNSNILNKSINEDDGNINLQKSDINLSIDSPKNEDIENVKKDFNNKLKQINIFYKNQFKNFQNDIIKLMNNKCKFIEKEITKIGFDMNNLDMRVLNLNEYIINKEIEIFLEEKKENKENIEKNNFNLENSFYNNGSQINIGTDKKHTDYIIVTQTQTNYDNYILKENDNNKDDSNNKNDFNSDFEDLEKTNEEVYKEEQTKSNGFFGYLGKQKTPSEKKLEKIKDIIKKLFNNNEIFNYSNNELIKKGKEIFKIMNENKPFIKLNDINKNFDNYLFKIHKDFRNEDKIKYYQILKEINKIIVIEKTKQFIYNFFKNEPKNKEIINENNLQTLIKSLSNNNNDYKKKIKEEITKKYLLLKE